jgi:ParB-like chromosome segregation protein Spo0J
MAEQIDLLIAPKFSEHEREFTHINPRDFDIPKLPYGRDFGKSIKAKGVGEPVVLGMYRNGLRVINGRRRILACQDAIKELEEFGQDTEHLDEIPAVIYHKADNITRDMWAVILNKHDENPLTAVHTVRSMLKKRPHNKMEISTALYVTPGTAEKLLRLAQLNDVFLTAATEANIALSTMEKIANKPYDVQDQAETILLEKIADGKKFTAKDLKKLTYSKAAQAYSQLPVFDNFEDSASVVEIENLFLVLDQNNNPLGLFSSLEHEDPIQAARSMGGRVFQLIEI